MSSLFDKPVDKPDAPKETGVSELPVPRFTLLEPEIAGTLRAMASHLKAFLIGRKSTALSLAKTIVILSPDQAVLQPLQPGSDVPKGESKAVTRIVDPEDDLKKLLSDKGLALPSTITHSRAEEKPSGNSVVGAPKGPKQIS